MNLFKAIFILIFLITPLNANTIYNLIKIPNLEIYEINTKNKLKYFYAVSSFRLGVQKNIVCLNPSKEDLENKYKTIYKNLNRYSYNFLKKIDISYLHIFPYSERNKTKALLIKNKLSSTIKQERRSLLQLLSNKKKIDFISKNLGCNLEVLFETYENGIVEGLTENYIRVRVKGTQELINQIHKVKLIDIHEDTVLGGLVH